MRWLLWCFRLLAESYGTINHYRYPSCSRSVWTTLLGYSAFLYPYFPAYHPHFTLSLLLYHISCCPMLMWATVAWLNPNDVLFTPKLSNSIYFRLPKCENATTVTDSPVTISHFGDRRPVTEVPFSHFGSHFPALVVWKSHLCNRFTVPVVWKSRL